MSKNDDEVLVRVEGVSKKFCRSLKKSLWYGVCDIASELNPFGRTAAFANPHKNLTTEDTESTEGNTGVNQLADSAEFLEGHSQAGLQMDSEKPASIRSANAPSAFGEQTGPDSESVLIHDIRGKKESIATDGAGLRDGEFFAVKDVSFELRRGDCLGLIGHNGAGKTTLLKMLNGLIKPDAGSITMRGRVGALIALGAGFNPILTGRENIYINGSVLGLAKKEIDAKIDEIIDFAEIGEFIDMPVMNYSSGMAVRLGFAVAVSLDPDVLIIDEVLAVGDLGFQAKCFNILNKKLKNSAVIFVSHSMPQVARVASKVLYMEHGEPICYTNDLGEGIEKYHGSFKNEEATVTGSGGAVLESFTLNGLESFNSKDTNARVRYSDSLEVGFRYRLSDTVQRCSISLCIYDKSLKMVAMVISRAQDTFFKNTSGINAVSVCIKDIPLAPGTYSLTINFTDAPEDSNEWGEILARYGAVSSFTVTGNKNHALSHAPIIFLGKWSY